MFKCPRARKQGQGQVLFKNKNKVKVSFKINVFASEKVFCQGNLGVRLKLPFQPKLIENIYDRPNVKPTG